MLETISTIAFVAVLAAPLCTYSWMRERRWHRVFAGIAAAVALGALGIGYLLLYRAIGFPPFMRWFPTEARSEPLPGKPEVQINTKLDTDWTVVGMNYEWMVLVAKAHLQVGSRPEVYMRWEHVSPQDLEDGKKFLSEVHWVELDCPAGRMNTLMIHSFAGNNFSGEQVYSGRGDPRNPEWDTPNPKSIFAASVRKGCELFGK